MLKQFKHQVSLHLPQLKQATTLLAVSGGVDSVVMTRLFSLARLPFAVAHCNFQLRGNASDEDEHFVRELSDELGVAYHTIRFETERLAQEKGVSIQMIARELRYDWLETVRRAHSYQYIATAHHLNDAIETSLLNQIRGTGIRGLTGIELLRGYLVRPLLYFTRTEIEGFLTDHGWQIREDSSNSKDEYYRNRIRHHVIPVMQSINPSLEPTFSTNFRIWSETTQLMEWAVAQLKRQFVLDKGGKIRIDLSFLEAHRAVALTLLYEWLKDFGFHPDQLQQAIATAGKSSGAIWKSATHRLLVGREAFYLEELMTRDEKSVFEMQQAGETVQLSDGELTSEWVSKDIQQMLGASPLEAFLDAEQLKFPLRIRRWQAGDVFCPLGMQGGRKKLQDFFTDLKINRFDKEKVWLLVNGDGEIAWVIGYRPDERFKIMEDTRKALRVCFQAS